MCNTCVIMGFTGKINLSIWDSKMEGTATKILGRATLTKYQALVMGITTWEITPRSAVDWLDPFFFYFWKTLVRYAKTIPLKMHNAGLLIIRAVADPRNSGISAKSREIPQKTRNTAKSARNISKYTSAKHI